MSKMNLKDRIEELEAGVKSGQITAGFALARLSLDYLEGSFNHVPGLHRLPAVGGLPRVARVSFRKNVETAPYKHEHAEVAVDVNDGTLDEALALAKRSVDQALGVDVTREEYERALLTLDRGRKAGFKSSSRRGRNVNAMLPSEDDIEDRY